MTRGLRAGLALAGVLLTQMSCSIDSLLCANDKVQRVFVHLPPGEYARGGVVMWARDSIQLGGSAGLDPSAEFCVQDEVMFTVAQNPGKFIWASTDSSVVFVNPAGMIFARNPGVAQISATVDGITSDKWKYTVGPRLKFIRWRADPPVGKVGVPTSVRVYAITEAGDTLADPLISPFKWTATGVLDGTWTKGKVETTENTFTPTIDGETIVSTHAYRTAGPGFTAILQYTVKP